MHIEFLVEERSAEAALVNLLPKILGPTTSYRIHVHQGKLDLLDNLGRRLKGYSSWLPDNWRIVVLVDADRDDCHRLKRRMTEIARSAGLATKQDSLTGRFHVLNRLAIEELEAWFFGDVTALSAAYPRVPVTLAQRARYRHSDAIVGGTWEALERELQRVGYFRSGLAKITAARNISQYMVPERNTSKSFQVFRDGLRGMCGQTA
jgi:hypothetical protein